MRLTKGQKVFQFFNYIFLSLLSFVFIFPFWRVISISLSEGVAAMRGGINFWPRKFTLDNYLVIFSRSDILDAYKISIGRTVIGTLLSIFLMALMAYGLSKKAFIGKKIINVMLIITMFFNGGLIPVYLLLRDLKLLDKFWVYIIPALYSAYYIFIFRTFFKSMPAELEESSRIDGANDLTVFFKIVFPLSLPVIASLSLFVAISHWNDWFAGMIYVTKRNLVPLQTLLVKILTENDSAKMIQQGAASIDKERIRNVTIQTVKMATLVAIMLPIICVYPFLQKYFVKGMMIGSLKG